MAYQTPQQCTHPQCQINWIKLMNQLAWTLEHNSFGYPDTDPAAILTWRLTVTIYLQSSEYLFSVFPPILWHRRSLSILLSILSQIILILLYELKSQPIFTSFLTRMCRRLVYFFRSQHSWYKIPESFFFSFLFEILSFSLSHRLESLFHSKEYLINISWGQL